MLWVASIHNTIEQYASVATAVGPEYCGIRRAARIPARYIHFYNLCLGRVSHQQTLVPAGNAEFQRSQCRPDIVLQRSGVFIDEMYDIGLGQV